MEVNLEKRPSGEAGGGNKLDNLESELPSSSQIKHIDSKKSDVGSEGPRS